MFQNYNSVAAFINDLFLIRTAPWKRLKVVTNEKGEASGAVLTIRW